MFRWIEFRWTEFELNKNPFLLSTEKSDRAALMSIDDYSIRQNHSSVGKPDATTLLHHSSTHLKYTSSMLSFLKYTQNII